MALTLLSLSLQDWQPVPRAEGFTTRHILPEDVADLAALYLASYPPAVGARSLAEAVGEIEDTLAGTYGTLRPDASFVVSDAGSPVGAIFVVESSIWDKESTDPFFIDLFVHPEHRRRGAGKTLASVAIDACAATGDDVVSLRVGKATTAEALHLFSSLGFAP